MPYKTNNKNYFNTKFLTIVAMLAAISAVLMFFSFSVPFFPGFLKFDLSEVPALIASFTLSPVAGISVVLIKNLINLLFTTTGGVGELANFIIGAFFVFTAGTIYRNYTTRKGAVIGMILGTVVMSAVGTLANYYILMPMYSLLMPIDAIINMAKSINPYADSLLKVMFFTIAPFNLLKGIFISFVTFLLYKKLSPIIKKFSQG